MSCMHQQPVHLETAEQIHVGCSCLPAGLFSATQTEAVEALARAGLRNPGTLGATLL